MAYLQISQSFFYSEMQNLLNSHQIAIVKILYRKCFVQCHRKFQIFLHRFSNVFSSHICFQIFILVLALKAPLLPFIVIFTISWLDHQHLWSRPCHPIILIIIIWCIWVSNLKRIIKGHELDNGDVIITTSIEYSDEIFFISWSISEIKNAYRNVSFSVISFACRIF